MNDSEKLRRIMSAVKVDKIVPFARMVNVSKSLIGGILKGDRAITGNLKLRFEKFLHINPDWFERPDEVPMFLELETARDVLVSQVEALLDANPDIMKIMEITVTLSPKSRKALLLFLESLTELDETSHPGFMDQ